MKIQWGLLFEKMASDKVKKMHEWWMHLEPKRGCVSKLVFIIKTA